MIRYWEFSWLNIESFHEFVHKLLCIWNNVRIWSSTEVMWCFKMKFNDREIKRNVSNVENSWWLFVCWFQLKCNSKSFEFVARKKFNKVVDDLLFNENILQNDIVDFNDFSLSMMLNFNVLCSNLKNKFFCQCHNALIVTTNNDSEFVKCVVTKTQLIEKLTKENKFLFDFTLIFIFNFTVEKNDRWLTLELSTESVAIDIKDVIENETTNDSVARSIEIRITRQVFKIFTKNKFSNDCDFQVTKNALDDDEMNFCKIKKKAIDHRDDKDDVWANFKHDIHEKINDELILDFEFDENFVIFRNDFQMKIWIHKNDHEFAVDHVMTIENKKK